MDPYLTQALEFANHFRTTKERRHGLHLHEGHDLTIAGILAALQPDLPEDDIDSDEFLARTLSDNGIRRILDLGCGDGGFLAGLASSAQLSGCSLTGVDLNPRWEHCPSTLDATRNMDIEFVCGDILETDVGAVDLVTASGVASFCGVMDLVPKPWHSEEVRTGIRYAHSIAQRGLDTLSDLSTAAVVLTTIGTVLMMYRHSVEEFACVYAWERPRHGDNYNRIWDLMCGSVAQKIWTHVWRQGAGLAVLRRPSQS